MTLKGLAVTSHVAGSVWKVEVKTGDRVKTGQTLMIVESMKMEIAVTATCGGVVHRVLCKEGDAVAPGQNLLVIIEDAP